MTEIKNDKRLTTKLLFFLRICFYCNVFGLITYLCLPVVFILQGKFFPNVDLIFIYKINQLITLPSIVLWGYCFYFSFKYDKYSSAGIKLFFLNFFYAPFYFYKVIWKRKRNLLNTYKAEPIIGNTIHLETYEEHE